MKVETIKEEESVDDPVDSDNNYKDTKVEVIKEEIHEPYFDCSEYVQVQIRDQETDKEQEIKNEAIKIKDV